MKKILYTASLFALSLSLSACGGGDSGPQAPSSSPPPVTPPSGPVTPPPPAKPAYDTAEYENSPALGASNAGYAYEKGYTGKGVTIAVIDSGIDRNNPEFAGRISPDSTTFQASYAPCGTCAPELTDFDLQDVQGHGTYVAGAAAAAKDDNGIQGMAYDSTILALKVVSPDLSKLDGNGKPTENPGTANINVLPDAINYAVNHNAFVINFSATGGTTDAPLIANLKAAMDNVRKHNLLFVESVSNTPNEDSFKDQIAQFLVGTDNSNKAWFLFGIALNKDLTPQVTTVTDSNGNVTKGNGIPGALADRTLSVVADSVPGVKVGGGTDLISGNSFAAPVIAGAAAILKQYWPQLGGKEISQILLDTATDLGPKGVDSQYGVGLLNMQAAMQAQAPAIGTQADNTVSVATTNLVMSGAFGGSDSTAKFNSLTGTAVVLDKYGRDYRMALSSVTGATRSRGLRLGSLRGRYGSPTSSNPLNMNQPYAYSGNGYGSALPEGSFSYMLGRGTSISGAVNSSLEQSDLVAGSMFEEANLATYGEWTEFNRSGYRLGFGHARNTLAGATSTTNRMNVGLPNGFNMALTAAHEDRSALGMRGNGAFQINGADSTFLTLGWAGPVGGWALSGQVMGGTTNVHTSSAMLGFKGNVLSTGFQFEASHALFSGRGSFGLTSPVKVDRANISFTYASDYNVDTQQLVDTTETFNLAPSAREMNLELGWGKTFDNGSHFSIATATSFNSGNIAGQTDHAFWLRFGKSL